MHSIGIVYLKADGLNQEIGGLEPGVSVRNPESISGCLDAEKVWWRGTISIAVDPKNTKDFSCADILYEGAVEGCEDHCCLIGRRQPISLFLSRQNYLLKRTTIAPMMSPFLKSFLGLVG